jgi:ABC-type sugar transport system substrate-binding protein
LKKCGFRVSGHDLKMPMTPIQLAEAIRAAASRSTGGLIVEAIDAEEVRAALHEAESKGLPIVLLDTPLPSSVPGKYYPSVGFTGFTEAGKQIVDTVTEDARELRLPEGAPVLILEYGEKDHYSRQRLESLTTALKAAGRTFEVLGFDGDQKGALATATTYLKDHPKTTIILSDYDFGIAGSFQAFSDLWKANRRIIVRGGYAALDARHDDLIIQMTEALGDRNIEGYARKVLELVIDLMEGRPTPERVELPIRFVRNPLRTLPTTAPKLRELTQPPRVGPSPPQQ